MKRMLLIASVVGAIAATPIQAVPTLYTGTLSVAGGGLWADGDWDDPDTTLSWTVDNTTTAGKWHYEYTLTVPTGAISHMIVEVSDEDPGPKFLMDNLFDPQSTPNGWIDDPIELQTQVGPGHPGIPEGVYGIKFNAADNFDETAVTVSFDSDRVPVWGDFYAKGGAASDGGDNVLYNVGFVSPDWDPTEEPDDGSLYNHLLVPDSASVIVPTPGALLLGSIGVPFAVWLRCRRTL